MSGEKATATDELRRAMALLDRWLDLPESQRAEELQRLRKSTAPGVFERLESLIRSGRWAESHDFLGRPAIADAVGAPQASEPTPIPAEMIGPWRLGRRLGEGGMGCVWLASRNDGLYQGDVAIKTLRDSAPDELAAARFAREGEILARLTHPHIARLLDAGTLAGGKRYLVLEYVRGERIDHYCDQHGLDVTARIRIFRQVCEAVAHAHANLIVHRDLKPANILVMEGGAVKLLDFGVAKMIEADVATGNESPLTRVAGAGLTPEYAAPEQIEGGSVTTATDVYSLGVVLYCLLAGRPPYGVDTRSPVKLAQAIVETTPAMASSAVGDDAEVAARRGATPERLRRYLRGDLDNIVAKALKKEPTERYPTAQALIDDLDAFLDDRPVAAQPDSPAYRIGKFVRRHRVGVALGALLAAGFFAGIAAIVWQARIALTHETEAHRQEAIARDRATFAEAESARARTEELRAKEQEAAAERYRTQAEREAAHARDEEAKARRQTRAAHVEANKATAVKDFLIDMFRASLPRNADYEAAQKVTARELLDKGTARLNAQLLDQPQVRAELLDIAGELYFRLGDHDKAKRLTLERMAALEKVENSALDRTNTASNLSYLAWTRGDMKDLRAADQLADQVRAPGKVDEEAIALHRKARLALFRDPRSALVMTEQSLAEFRRHDHVATPLAAIAQALDVMAEANALMGRSASALSAASAGEAAMRRLWGSDASVFVAMQRGRTGRLERAVGQLAAAEKTLKGALDRLAKALGPAHPETLVVQAQLGALQAQTPHHAEGIRLMADALRRSKRGVSRNTIDEAVVRLDLTRAWLQAGRFSDATTEAGTLVSDLRTQPDLRLLLADALDSQAWAAMTTGDHETAIAAATEAKAIRVEAIGGNAPAVANAWVTLGEAQLAAGSVAEVRSALAAADRIADDPDRRFSDLDIRRELLHGSLRLAASEKMGAAKRFQQVIERIEDDDERDYRRWPQARALLGLGRALFMTGELDRAHESLQRAIDLHRQLGDADSPWLAETKVALADCLISQGEQQAAAHLLAEASAAFAKQPVGRQFRYPLEKVSARLSSTDQGKLILPGREGSRNSGGAAQANGPR